MDYRLRDAKPLYKSWINDSGDVVRLIDPDAIADADYSNTEAIRAYGSSARSFLTDETPLGNIRRWLNRRSRSTGKTWLYGKPKGY